MKICSKCQVPKDEEEFDKRKGGKLQGYCISCRKEKINKHYQDNKDYYKKKATIGRRIAGDKYVDFKRTLACQDCGLSFKDEPYLCDFHHGTDKLLNPSKLRLSYQKFLKEIEKCTPLCANCHRRRHNMHQ